MRDQTNAIEMARTPVAASNVMRAEDLTAVRVSDVTRLSNSQIVRNDVGITFPLTERDARMIREHGPLGTRTEARLGCGSYGLDRAHGLGYTRDMTIKRLDHVSVVVDDLAAAITFFTALGMTLDGEAPIEGPWVDRINGLEGVRVNIAMMRTPDGHGLLELTKFHNPKLVEIEPAIAPPNALGLRSIMFTVESVDDTVARLRAIGAELVGEVAQYEDKYRLCYMRGPAGIIVALAEELS
jgi:catechol 2,3-dioxygenase-like lactoylglutathione lyase family enzyme